LVKESLGLSVYRVGTDTLKAASNPAEDNGAFLRLNLQIDFTGGRVFEAAPSGMEIDDGTDIYTDSTVFLPVPGEHTLAQIELLQVGSSRTFLVPAP